MDINRKLVLILLICLLPFIFIAYFIWSIINEPQPQFFPLNNHQSRYTVIESSKMLQGWVEKEASDSSILEKPRYYIEYRGEGVFEGGYDKFFRITVGKSKIDLKPFLNKDVIITKGDFVSSSKQCVVDKCIDIGGPFVVLDIDNLESVGK